MLKGLIGVDKPCQIDMIVKDVRIAGENWARFLGKEMPPVVNVGDYAITKTVFGCILSRKIIIGNISAFTEQII